MYLCYVDESGTPDVPGNTSHFVLAGLAIPIDKWHTYTSEIDAIKARYDLANAEIHVAWLMRPYAEQKGITDFGSLKYERRRSLVRAARTSELLRLQRTNIQQFHQTRKNFRMTDAYAHLSLDERRALVMEIAVCVSQWSEARLFAECIDKIHYDPHRSGKSVGEEAFEQVVSRFEHYLQALDRKGTTPTYGLMIHDNNETVARKHTGLMKRFHQSGTLWTRVNHIIETPFFVDSQLTGMVQIADVSGYALRRYLENNETKLFELIFQRADRRGTTAVGVRHFTELSCSCKICMAHRRLVR